MADGLVCVTQSEDGELVLRFKRYVTFIKKSVAVEGTAALGADVLEGLAVEPRRQWKVSGEEQAFQFLRA